MSNYIDKLGPRNKGIIANLRCTGLPLRVTIGVYYDKITYNECVCERCNNNLVEDEYHFLLVCPLYSDIRKKHIPVFYWSPPTIIKFKQILCRTDLKCLNQVASYISEALTRRSELNQVIAQNAGEVP